jgi:hypothetical protein
VSFVVFPAGTAKLIPMRCLLIFLCLTLNGLASPSSWEDVNRELGLNLLADKLLWDDPPGEVAERLSLRRESKTAKLSSFRGRGKVLGLESESIILAGTDKITTELNILFANKGDTIGTAPERKKFDDDDKYEEALEAFQEKLAGLEEKIEEQADALESKLTKLFGDSRKTNFGKDSTKQKVHSWIWKKHAILLAMDEYQSVSVKILSEESFDRDGQAEKISNRDLKKILKKRVVIRENGDVIVSQIPMVNQGGKGYCVPSTWARYLRYLGIPADEYALANVGGTQAGGGTSPKAMANAVSDILRSYKRDLESRSSKTNIRFVSKYIDDGLPLMWGMYAVGPFEKPGLKEDRMGDLSPEDYAKSLKEQREKDEEIQIDRSRGHMCMIIGYNPITEEICTSDSWGRAHEEKWFTVEAVQAVSTGSHYIIKW